MGIVYLPPSNPYALRYRWRLHRIAAAELAAFSAQNYKLAAFWEKVRERVVADHWSR